jgi:hypothetical protein
MNAAVRRWTVAVAAVGVAVCWAVCVKAETRRLEDKSPATANGRVDPPRDYEGRILVFPDDSNSYTNDAINLEKFFTFNTARESLDSYWKRSSAQNNFHDAFTHHARIENAPELERDKRPPLEPYGLDELPDDAVIVWKMSKQELAEFDLPGWESRALGMPNIYNYLRAWIDYQQYTVARLRLQLLELRGVTGSEEQAALEEVMKDAKDRVVEYYQTAPAD